jgi:LPS export ABC transporter protein LptC
MFTLGKSSRLLLPLLALALGAMLWSLQQFEREGVVVGEVSDRAPRYLVDNAVLDRFDETGVHVLHGTATHLQYFDDESAKARDLDATTLVDDQPGWNLTSPSALLPAKSKRFLLQGDVVARGKWPDNGLPVTVRTTEVWIDPATHVLNTDENVAIDSDGRDGTATGLRADWIARRVELLHNVKMRYDQRR